MKTGVMNKCLQNSISDKYYGKFSPLPRLSVLANTLPVHTPSRKFNQLTVTAVCYSRRILLNRRHSPLPLWRKTSRTNEKQTQGAMVFLKFKYFYVKVVKYSSLQEYELTTVRISRMFVVKSANVEWPDIAQRSSKRSQRILTLAWSQ